jgi:hypothetical protein
MLVFASDAVAQSWELAQAVLLSRSPHILSALKVGHWDSLSNFTALECSTLAQCTGQEQSSSAVVCVLTGPCGDGAKAANPGVVCAVVASTIVCVVTITCPGVLVSCLQQKLQVGLHNPNKGCHPPEHQGACSVWQTRLAGMRRHLRRVAEGGGAAFSAWLLVCRNVHQGHQHWLR